MSIEQLYSLFLGHPVISTDSRNVSEGCIFFALKGQNFDGNTYVKNSLEKGAAWAVSDNARYSDDPRVILVDDVLKTLQKLANYHRKKLNIPVLAITGTNGKTTTKELTAAVLSQKYQVTYTQGNLNNHIGVPLTLLKMNQKTEIAIVEMGANHPGEIAELCAITEPDYGLITNIGKAHLEGFGSFEGVIKTKSEMYRFLRETQGKCFINCDNQLLMGQAEGLELLTYGSSDNAQLQGVAEGISYFLTVKALFPKGWLYLKSKLIGNYNFENVLAAARVGLHFQVDPIKIQQAIELYQPSNNRSQLMQKGSNLIIMDAYNANPTSMMEALRNFVRIEHDSKTLILGDMLELGEHSLEEHQRIVDFISLPGFINVFLVGKQFMSVPTDTKMKKFETVELLHDYLNQLKLLENQLILVKGSRGIRLEKILDII